MATLDVPFYNQEHPVSCLPACARMVLAFWGKKHAEQELVEAFRLHPLFGVQPNQAVAGIQALGYRGLWFENATLTRINETLQHGWPVIVFVRAIDLPHGQSGVHSLVLTGFQDELIYCLDPALKKKGNIIFAQVEFTRIWKNLNNQGILIWLPGSTKV